MTVVTVNIGNIDAVVQSQGKDMAAKASVGNFAMSEGGNMEMEMFLQSVSLGNIFILPAVSYRFQPEQNCTIFGSHKLQLI